jgi:two-component sensor histidine kinase
MEQLVEEREVLAEELKHRVRNNLHLVHGLLTAELDGQHAEASIAAFRSIALRVMGMAGVFDHLLGTGMTKVINFGDYVTALCECLPDLYAGPNIKFTSSIEPLNLHLDDATALGTAITELINNAFLHAFPSGVGEISLELRITGGQILLSISDNGIGFVGTESKRHGMGLVRRLVQQVGASLSLQSDHGSNWTIALPLDKVSALAAA